MEIDARGSGKRGVRNGPGSIDFTKDGLNVVTT